MRARGPYEVKPQQLRALVLLLALLPLIPTTFVVRFLVDDIVNERVEARERARPGYQKFLESASASLSANATRQLPQAPSLIVSDPWHALDPSPESGSGPAADSVLIVAGDGRLVLPAPPPEGRPGSAAALAQAVLDSGVHYFISPPSGPVRWRFFCEAPEALFALQPKRSAAISAGLDGSGAASLLLLRSRQHLVERIGAFYQRALGPQSSLRLLDENGDSIALTNGDPGLTAFAPVSGDPLAEVALPPPLPAWRVQLFSVDTSLVDGIAREQIAFYWWSVGGMFVVTALIAGAAGWALTRRIALHELSNDALAVVSHEMKTPLASTRMFIDTLLERRYRGGEAQADDYLRLIGKENGRLERLVDSFQTLSRLGGARGRRQVEASRETLRVEEIIDAATRPLHLRLEAPGCDFRVEIEGEPPPFQGSGEELTAVLINLLDNALKYTGAEKRIALRARTARGGREVIFEVADNGVGIERKEQGRIFERFYQSDRRLSRSHEGCGLGLSIVRSVVSAHGGAVSVRSAPGEGSTFLVRLPIGTTAGG